jgi:signal transduction histidine kinase
VIRNGQRLQRLINQLLDLSKVEAGKMRLHTSQVDIVELLRQIVASYESLAKEKNIRYFFYPEVNELVTYVDEEKIEKIIHNLLSNAFKFTKEGGEVILHLRAAEKSVVISVRDSGIGIPEEQLDKIFDRFYQVDSSQTRSYEGSGLGIGTRQRSGRPSSRNNFGR